MDIKLKRVRGSGLYKTALFIVTTVLMITLLQSIETRILLMREYMYYGYNYFEAPNGASKDATQAIEQVTEDYLQERLGQTAREFEFTVTGRRGEYTSEGDSEGMFDRYKYAVKIEGDAVQFSRGFRTGLSIPVNAAETPDMTIAFSDQWIDKKVDEWAASENRMQDNEKRLITQSILLILLLVEQIAVVGRSETGALKSRKVDRIPTELLLLAVAVLGYGSIQLLLYQLDEISLPPPGSGRWWVSSLLVAMISALWLLGLWLIRKLKTGTFFRHSVMGQVLLGIRFMAVGPQGRTPEAFRVLRILIGFLVVSVGWILVVTVFYLHTYIFVFVELGLFVFTLYLTYDILKKIDDSVHVAVQEQLTSERMKVDLITNVSHDLNTPLTSIIGYVDLLQDEEMSDAAKDYVSVLQNKSLRLKGIVSDLFDLSKSTSGAIDVNKEILDYCVLIRQTIADLQDKIDQSGLQIVQKLPDEPVYVYADGKHLYRVLQNLIDNALRYAMPKTRIFLTLVEESGTAHLKMKNVSAYPLDFDEEEILSRFVRGDISRSEEGSGLGLAISKSFTENNGGTFQVFVQEDIFIAYQTFRTMQEEN